VFRRLILIALALILVAVALGWWPRPIRGQRQWANPTTLDSVITPGAHRIILASDRVRAFLVGKHLWTGDSSATALRIAGVPYPARSRSTYLTRQQADSLKAKLLDVRSYQRFAKLCEFNPTVAYIFYAGPDSAQAAICLGCFDVAFDPGASWGHFDPIGLEMTRLASKVFPRDSTLAHWVEFHEKHP
jgi:hypothetical protein